MYIYIHTYIYIHMCGKGQTQSTICIPFGFLWPKGQSIQNTDAGRQRPKSKMFSSERSRCAIPNLKASVMSYWALRKSLGHVHVELYYI
jgi:hypothetical protein